jgi:molybdate transport system ATP-binding protein
MLAVNVEHRVGALDLHVEFQTDARITALFGRSGAGKTTLVDMIAGLRRPDRGRIVVDGRVLFDSEQRIDLPARRRRVGYVFQEGRLFPHLTVERNLLYGHALAREAERFVSLEHIVELLGLDGLLDRRPGDLSGGEKQRVAIGRALLAGPRVLLMDEPLASLDAPRKAEILSYIERLRDDMGVPIVYVSHAVDEVVRLADWVVLMSAGQVAAAGHVEEIMGRPDLGTAGGIFEGGTVIDAKVIAHDREYDIATLAFEGGTLSVTNVGALVGEMVRVRVRARDVSIALQQPAAISIQNVLPGRITKIGETHEGAVNVSVAIGAVTLRSRVTRRAAEQLSLAPGMNAYVLIKAVSLDRHGVGYAG